ncbi:MAG TPA: hypothetical protein VKS82_21380 [Streptosporangiaceae bacterium]|nr:hypothetical protein [Streptosporangiaceae bacterium]
MGRPIRVPLRVLFACLAVTLVAPAAAVIGMAGLSAASGYLIGQADDSLQACASSMRSHGLVAQPSSSPVPPGVCGTQLRSVSGQLLAPASPGAAGPLIPASGPWLAAHLARPVTVPGAGASGRWRVVIEAVRYQPQHILYVYGPDDVRYVISRLTGHGASGMLAIMTRLAGTGPAAARYTATAGAVLVMLATAALACTRAILRPSRGAAELTQSAGQTAAAARRPAAEVSERLAEVLLALRRPVSIVHGFAHYCRQHGKPSPADVEFDRMLRRVADAAARMEMLIEALHALSLGGPTGPDPGPYPADPGHLTTGETG